MIVHKASNVEGIRVEKFPYKGVMREVTGVTLRWLSKRGTDAAGNPAYGLRHFTVAPGGSIPAHAHYYLQTVYIESGEFECLSYDPDTDEVVETCLCGPGQSVFVDFNEPHGMRNTSTTEPATFLCCVCSLGDGEVSL